MYKTTNPYSTGINEKSIEENMNSPEVEILQIADIAI
jgi:hypothetical protein